MNNFNFSLKQNIVFGEGSVEQLPELMSNIGAKSAMIITDASLVKLGFVEIAAKSLEKANINYTIFSEIEPNPSIETVTKAAEAIKESGAKAVIAFGGGSPMDVAKAASVVATFGGKVADYAGAGNVPGKIMPIIAIPTTAGTGSESTATAVITDHKQNLKFPINSPEIIAEYAVLDPNFILTLPKQIAAPTGVDAIVHALEAYISNDADPFSDSMAEKALDLLGKNIRAFVADRKNVEAASGMLIGSNFAGIAFAKAKLGNIHAMAHPLGGFFDIAHGVANAVLLPHVMKFNLDYVEIERLERIYRYITRDFTETFEKEMLVDALFALCEELEIPKTLTELKVTRESIPAMSIDAMKSANVKANPRPTTVEDIEKLFEILSRRTIS